MYIPLVTRTVATALSTAAATIPAVHTDGLSLDKGHVALASADDHRHYDTPEDYFDPDKHPPGESWWDGDIFRPNLRPLDPESPHNLSVTSPGDAIPGPFLPDHPDQKYYNVGEEPLTGCIRDAVKEAGRERWIEITHADGGPEEFLRTSRDNGLVGEDTNKDSNDVHGMIQWVRTLAGRDNPDLDPATSDPEKCASLVKRFATPELVDELIIAWAVKLGHIWELPPTKPQPEETHAGGNLTSRGNVTTHGHLRHGISKTRRHNSSTATGPPPPVKSGASLNEARFQFLKAMSRLSNEIFELFGRDEDRLNSFWAKPSTRELLYNAIEEYQYPGINPGGRPIRRPLGLKFLKGFVQNALAEDHSFSGL